MNDNTPHPPDTRHRILDTACRLFAEKGYRETTIALISRDAGVNIAAVNYHFGGKESLYQEAWRHAHDRMIARVPPDGGVAADKPAAERLRGRIRAGLQRAMAGEAIEFEIMRKEMANPTGLLRQVIQDAIRPKRQALQSIVRELLGPHANDLDAEVCETCVVAPLLHLIHRRQAQKHDGLAPIFREDMLDDMVDRFTHYALAGIHDARTRLDQANPVSAGE